MELKAGKRYETANGDVFKVRKFDREFFDFNDNTSYLWKSDGKGIHTPDLIRRHYWKPQHIAKLGLKMVTKLLGVKSGG